MTAFMLTHPTATAPRRGTYGSAGFDLSAIEGGTIQPHTTVRFRTGVCFHIPEGYCGFIFPRSSWTDKLDTKSPPIDSDFRGEVRLIVVNTSNSLVRVPAGMRIAQIVIIPVLLTMKQQQTLPGSSRGEGAFGSTGDKPNG